jgi:mRNA-degrading endonuclease RelE of RelBE toxin-antitoxin system/DNA-binding XRE family transcriptional regulator
MKAIRYSAASAKSLRRYRNVAERLRRTVAEYAADPAAHANNVVQLVGSPIKRIRVGDYRILFEETESEIIVLKIGPRGDVYRCGGRMMNVQRIRSPSGEEMVVLSAEDFEDLVDAREAAILAEAIRAGRIETLSEAEMDEYLAAPTPLAFWRRRRGLTQAALAAAARVSQPFIAQLEAGMRRGDISTYRRLARALSVTLDDLLPDEGDSADG